MGAVSYQEVKIASGQSLSTEVDLRGFDLVAIDMPAAWTAGAISFASCVRPDGGPNAVALTETYDPVYDDGGTEVSITAVQATYVVLRADAACKVAGLGRCKIRSGLVGAAVNQGADRIITLVLQVRS